MTKGEVIRAIIAGFDTARGSKLEDLREQLLPFGRDIVPHLAWGMETLRRQESRDSLLYTATKFARVEPEVVGFAVRSLNDRGTWVRHRAAMLLAFACDPSALPALKQRAEVEPRDDIRADIEAAMNAIEQRDHNLWADRTGSGQVHWNVGGAILPEDEA